MHMPSACSGTGRGPAHAASMLKSRTKGTAPIQRLFHALEPSLIWTGSLLSSRRVHLLDAVPAGHLGLVRSGGLDHAIEPAGCVSALVRAPRTSLVVEKRRSAHSLNTTSQLPHLYCVSLDSAISSPAQMPQWGHFSTVTIHAFWISYSTEQPVASWKGLGLP